MGCSQSKALECPKCGCTLVNNREFLTHWEREHESTPLASGRSLSPDRIQCPRCNESGFSDLRKLISHVENVHIMLQNAIVCPKCNLQGFIDGAALLDHCERFHDYVSGKKIFVNTANNAVLPQVESVSSGAYSNTRPTKVGNKSLPRVGDKVLAMWVHTQWQYFHATIRRFIPDELKYEIDWDDQDTTGRIVDYFNLALDKSPDPKEISIGSIVLFPQGYYKGSEGGATEGIRWHQGRVTKIHTSRDGTKLVDGYHTKGTADGKWITYNGYSYTFEGLRLGDLRIGPNVFDILDDDADEDDDDLDDIDIYFSYSMSDSPKAIKNQEIQLPPTENLPLLDKLCDPQDILDCLKQKGLNIAIRKTTNSKELKKTAAMMRKAKVFIACISNQYVANNECRMEFQFAKSTLGKPIVPLVVGDGSFDWTMSVIGMLIAGELYIHFKDKSVEKTKLNELLLALKSHFHKIADITDSGAAGVQVKGQADIFLSYCWTNSLIAKEANQIETVVGNRYADPRHVKAELERAGFKVWLDIERLRSADANADMYVQLTNALKDAKAIVPFVSTEYANSPNCRMEFQFAMKSLGKPILPVIVGEGDGWKTSVIGALVASNNNEPITLQDVTSQTILDDRLKYVFEELKRILSIEDGAPTQEKVMKYRAPRVGDHVISHHKRCSYFMATIVDFNSSSLEYTVAWDDRDPSGRVQPYNQVALDIVPEPDDVGAGSIVFFPQGKYGGTEGNNTGGQRYHEGLVTSCREYNGTKLITGHHTKGEADGKWVTYKGYSYEFQDCPLNEIRIAPSAMDALLAAKS